ncbi:MAG: UDP-N-acetylmuramoyl-tripeptide--D-alanyl-D-alanine ligase [Gemmatimonadetes bacterium]|nr:UDP-N-acetylmuramoyl-tripeptide--D-alanyl-D-alanine ligase [Gemmatimonadota bacterium]
MSAFTWTDAGVRTALGLRVDLARDGVEYEGVSTDSRTIRKGELYVALVGDRFDGHDFVAEAFASGARAAVVSRAVPGDTGGRLYPVEDTLLALGALARYRRDYLAAPVVGITGSAGKTTTKDLTRAALAGARRVHATAGNLNNQVGMPLTLLAAPDDAEAVVLEMGTNEPGEIAALAAVARPDVGVVTTVGEAHLEQLGSLEGVLEEKLDLLRGLAQGGRCVVGDEPDVLVRKARSLCGHVRVAGWSERADEDLRPDTVEVDHWGNHTFRWRGRTVALSLPGRHAVTNALLALAVSDLLGIAPRAAVAGLSGVTSGPLRGELRRIGDLAVVVDCYNANPPSVRVALELLEGQQASRRVAVLGTMLELGDASARLHRQMLSEALERDVDLVVATGAFAEAASSLGVLGTSRVLTAATWQEAYPALRERLGGSEVVLLKASRGVAMEGILPLLEADFGDAGAGDAPEEA